MMTIQLWLRIEQIHLTGTTVHEKVNDAIRLGNGWRRLGDKIWQTHCFVRRDRAPVVLQETGECGTAQPRSEPVKKPPSGQMLDCFATFGIGHCLVLAPKSSLFDVPQQDQSTVRNSAELKIA